MFEKLKETLKLNVEKVKWAAQERRNALITKIDDLKIAVPDISYLTNSNSAYRSTKAHEVFKKKERTFVFHKEPTRNMCAILRRIQIIRIN